MQKRVVQPQDLFARSQDRLLVLGARFIEDDDKAPTLAVGPLRLRDLEIEIKLDFAIEQMPKLSMSVRTEGANIQSRPDFGETRHDVEHILTQKLPAGGYDLVGANRLVRRETEQKGSPSKLLREGYLQRALLAALHSPNHETRRRLDEFRSLLTGSPLHRPPFDLVINESDETAEVHELLPEPNPDKRSIPLASAGLGVAQMYVILARIMLSGARAIAVEEPEAHLHAPTSGVHLRELLQRLVHERFIDQLFIATHSNLFDLDPTWYWDVSLVDGETRVERRPLDDIDARHLYEPGPAKHALAQLLHYAPPDEVVFRRPDGAPVTAQEMTSLLQRDDETALHFLRNLHGAALRVVRLDARRRGGAT